MLQSLAAAGVEEAPVDVVGVEIDERLLLQLVRMLLDPLGGADQARLLGVPAEVDDGLLRPPAGLGQATHRLCLGHHRPVP